MIEMRWIVEEREQSIPPADRMHWPLGKPYPVQIVSIKKLQYRQLIDTTVRAGIWPADDIVRTANMQWSEWRDVPEVVERDMGCP